MFRLSNFSWRAWLAVFFAVFPIVAFSQIESVTRLTAHPNQYARMDFVIMATARWETSPYHAKEVQLDLKLLSPSGRGIIVPGFFDKGQSGRSSVWRVRFTPIETGEYTGEVVLANGQTSHISPKLSFQVAPAKEGNGFLHVNGDWTFRFDNGEPFRGIGENIGWESRNPDDSRYFRAEHENPRYNYDYMLGNLAANGGNFFRTWMSSFNLPLEWKTVRNTNRYANDTNYFNASAMQRMDQLVDLTESLDIYMMLTLDTCSDFQGWSWQHNSYNLTNGGPVATPQEFFTNPDAKAQYQDRLRYLVARWGYSPHIAAWEFFNEIDNLMYGLPQKIPDEIITDWHKEMGDYLKSIDPYNHLVTTSISHRPVAGLYSIPSFDFNQIHIYGHNGQSRTASFAEVLRRDSKKYDKPFVIGECGFEWDWNKNFNDFAGDMDEDFKQELWLGLFSPTPILPMSWWWEFFDRRGMTQYIGRVRLIMNQMLASGNGAFADAECEWKGAPTQVMAVRCGKTFFVLLNNDGAKMDAGDISLPLDKSQSYQVLSYDPDRNLTNNLAKLPPGETAVTGVSLAPASRLILIVDPK